MMICTELTTSEVLQDEVIPIPIAFIRLGIILSIYKLYYDGIYIITTRFLARMAKNNGSLILLNPMIIRKF